ncbi:33 kDa inner dynein arm light chain, axonemal-like [Cimex lectularius]|uniref:Uncharacterized protein n=1 Tax=Cimex lectularius TaxID=79782 RepID=A0A8I6RWY6_CIMLE|nr:33 kDa inner dynein arm light chain, axonemal-like [Cimex lectularius]
MEERLYEPHRLLPSTTSLLKYGKPCKVPPPPVPETRDHDCLQQDSVVEKDDEEEEKEVTIRDILDSIFHPKSWVDKYGNHWLQSVSGEHVSRSDVIRLTNQLENQLRERNVNFERYCPVRRAIFKELFDEMIRQEVIVCPERGLFLLKIRNEFKLWESAYNAMYENSVLYGIKKSVEVKQDLASIEKAAADETLQHNRLMKEIRAMEDAVQMSEKRYEEIGSHLSTKYKEKIDFYVNLNNSIKAQINAIMQPKRFLIPVTKTDKRPSEISPSQSTPETSQLKLGLNSAHSHKKDSDE